MTELNQSLGITDSLTNGKEIRIYKGFGISNYTGIFRMYQDSTERWTAELIEHYAKVPNRAKLKIKKKKLKPGREMDLVWFDLIKTNIQDLPNMSKIEWKLKEKPEIQDLDGEKDLVWKKTQIIDGESYVVEFRWGKNKNRITYSNPESYLRIYENVDELIYFNELLNLVRSEFGVWKK